jgi:hypothetical protein
VFELFVIFADKEANKYGSGKFVVNIADEPLCVTGK